MKMPRKSDLASVRINRNKPKSLEWRKRQAAMPPPIDAALAVRTTGSNQGSSRWGETPVGSETEIEAEMSEREEDIDSDAPEEFTSEQGIQNDEELRKVQEENKARCWEWACTSKLGFSVVEHEPKSLAGYSSHLSVAIDRYIRLIKIIPYADNINHGPLCRIAREGKDRRRQWAQKKTPRKPPRAENILDVIEPESTKESQDNAGMLPNDIVKLLAAREKKVFESDSEGEKEETTNKKRTSKKKRSKSSGHEPIILKDLPPPQCLQNSLEFLKKRKMQVARSSSVLNNSNQALRLLSKSGLLKQFQGAEKASSGSSHRCSEEGGVLRRAWKVWMQLVTASAVLLAPSEMLTSSAFDIGWLLDAMEANFFALMWKQYA
ncbi:hypothetical protein C3L33_01179, partial [Rhododendron williamsianum]